MMSALINALCYKRARGELLLSQRTIQKNMSLPAMAALYVEAKKNGWHSEGYAALESYLENTPGLPAGQRGIPGNVGSPRLRTA